MNKIGQINSLTGIRFILFLFVCFSNIFREIIVGTAFEQKLHYMYLGGYAVMFFFVLSGFCIGINYIDKFTNLTFENVKNFIIKRLVKFYPLYFLTGLIIFLFCFYPQNVKWLYAFVLLYVPMLQSYTIYYDAGGNGAAWFLASLFSCYMVTPFILYYLKKYERSIFNIKGLAILLLSLYLIIVLFSITQLLHPEWFRMGIIYRIPLVRIFHYGIGLVLGLLYVKYFQNIKFNFSNNAFMKLLCDILLIAIFVTTIILEISQYDKFSHGIGLPFQQIVCVPLFAFTILYLCNNTKGIFSYLLENKLVIFLGKISFECYLIHYVLVELLKTRLVTYCNSINNIIAIITCILLVTILLSIIYKYIYGKVTKFVTK